MRHLEIARLMALMAASAPGVTDIPPTLKQVFGRGKEPLKPNPEIQAKAEAKRQRRLAKMRQIMERNGR